VARLDDLNARTEDPALWDDPAAAQRLMRERTRLAGQVDGVRAIEAGLAEHADMIALAAAEGEDGLVAEAEAAIFALQRQAARRQVDALLSGEADGCDAFVSVNAGAGGTEAQDWAAMLRRMYVRWAEGRGFSVTPLEESPGEEAGIKSATFRISGEAAYGWAKTEAGVHRLVRISPFDSGARRHTSFASVSVAPVVDESIDVALEDKDLRVDTYRSQGAGGQHVNTTDSAVRITHIPTGIAVACQSERSQHQNRAHAMEMLRARLYEAELARREEAAAREHGAKTDIAWGHQIRSYVLQPYQMVKDARTGVERTDPGAVLDGDIDGFLEAALAARAGGHTA
jgi:peptide chain release factor 2